jgi:ATP-binding cassette subfamily B protein
MLVGDALQGIRVVKAFGQEPTEMYRYGEANHDLVEQNIRADGMWQGVFPLFALISTSGAILVWYFGGWMVLRDEITLGTLMAFTAYLGMFFGPLQWFSQAINWTSRAMAAADRVFEIMDTPSDVPDDIEPVVMEQVKGRVVLHQVTYGYETHHPVLKDINLTVEPGEMIGLVGHSGAGKSTLINMICRFYDPNQGFIIIDGVPLKKIKQEELRKQIGVVLQETFLFDGTITDNIAYSKPDATPEEIMRAAKIANAHDFIVRLPDGYDTRVGERGHRLSGGEKQRIAIARAIVHDPRILILDEATASVDTETERQIQEAISRLVKGRTTFAIAHRLSTLRNADRLVVLDKGQIAEIGTHEELLDKQGVYFKLVEAQRELSKIRGVQS